MDDQIKIKNNKNLLVEIKNVLNEFNCVEENLNKPKKDKYTQLGIVLTFTGNYVDMYEGKKLGKMFTDWMDNDVFYPWLLQQWELSTEDKTYFIVIEITV